MREHIEDRESMFAPHKAAQLLQMDFALVMMVTVWHVVYVRGDCAYAVICNMHEQKTVTMLIGGAMA